MTASVAFRPAGMAVLLLAAAFGAFARPAAAQPAPAPARKRPPPLRRILFLPRVEDVAPAGAPAEGPALDATRVPSLADPAAQARLRPFLGRPLDDPTLMADLRAAVADDFKAAGRPFVRTTIPRQDVTNGVVQLVVIEGRVGKVTVEGARWFDEDQYLGALHLEPGGPIDQPRLQADLDWLNRNPYRHATAVAQAGATPETTDFVIRADERRPFAFNAGFDNTGTKATGLSRVSAGVDWGSAFWRGDGLSYQFSGSPDSTAVRQHSLSYTTDLPWRHTLNLTAAYATTHSVGSGDFGSTGVSKIATARYAIPLKPAWGWSQHVGLGFDFKSTNNDILFGGQSVFPTVSEVDQFVAEYVAQAQDRAGATGITLAAVGSPGGMSAHNHDADFDAQQAGAKAQYGYLRAAVSRTTRLTPKLTWSARVVGQLAGGTLLPSEQIAFGGVSSVRGMLEQATIRDSGVMWQNELRPAAFAVGPRAAGITLSPFWFVDAGFGRNHDTFAGAPSTRMAEVTTGPGLNLQISRYLGARLTWGKLLLRKGTTGDRQETQFGISATF